MKFVILSLWIVFISGIGYTENRDTLKQLSEELQKVIPEGWNVKYNDDGVEVWRTEKVMFVGIEPPGYIEPRIPKPPKPPETQVFHFLFRPTKYISPENYDKEDQRNKDIDSRLLEFERTMSFVEARASKRRICGRHVAYQPKTKLEEKRLAEYQKYYDTTKKTGLPDCHYQNLSFHHWDPRGLSPLESTEIDLECGEILESIRQVVKFYREPGKPNYWQTYSLTRGGAILPLIFQGDIDKDSKYEISCDLDRIFHPATSHRFLHDEPSSWEIHGRKFESTKFLHLEGKEIFYPLEFGGKFGAVIEIEGVDHLVVSSELISRYQKALKLNMEIEDELKLLWKFFQQFDKTPLAGPVEKYYWTDSKDGSPLNQKNYLLAGRDSEIIDDPSILNILKNSGERFGNEITLLVHTTTSDRRTSLPNGTALFVFRKGEWKRYAR